MAWLQGQRSLLLGGRRLSRELADSMVRGSALRLCLVAAFSTANGMVLLGGRKSRYFTVEQTLPPLSRHMLPTNQTETLPYSSSSHHGRSLPVVYTNDPSVVNGWLDQNMPTSNGVVGFDVESVPQCPWVKRRASFQGPATVQLATTESCLVVHLTRRNGRPSRACAPILEAVLSDESIVKAGVGIDADVVELWRWWNSGGHVEAKSRLDVGGIGVNSKGTTVGLARLTRSILGVELGKTKKQARSDWSQVPLTDAQLIYSARDAWAGAAVVAELASIAPGTFGTDALVKMLESEPPIHDLIGRVESRQNAKKQIASIMKPYVRKRHHTARSHPVRKKQLPPKVQKKIWQLRKAVAESSMEGPMMFDVEPLGLKIHEPMAKS